MRAPPPPFQFQFQPLSIASTPSTQSSYIIHTVWISPPAKPPSQSQTSGAQTPYISQSMLILLRSFCTACHWAELTTFQRNLLRLFTRCRDRMPVTWTLHLPAPKVFQKRWQLSSPQHRPNTTTVSLWQLTFTLWPTVGLVKPMTVAYRLLQMSWDANTTDFHTSEMSSFATTTDFNIYQKLSKIQIKCQSIKTIFW
jgi:hypothetical protein